MADNTPNTPAPAADTGALSIDEAVDALMKPLPPPRRDTQPATTDATDRVADTDPDDEDDDQDQPQPAETDADTERDQPEPTDDDADAPAPEDQDKPATEPHYKVVVDGEEATVPASELVKGYQRQAVFTQRSQALATERRAFESERDAVSQERGQYARLLVALKGQIEGGGEVEPDWAALEATDPQQFTFQAARWAEKRRKLAAIDAEQRRVASEEGRKAQEGFRQHLDEQARLLLEKVPEYKDPKVRTRDREAIRSFAVQTYGFSTDEIDQLIDHRAVLVLRDAVAYRRLQAKKPTVEKRVVETNAPLPRNRGPVTPGTPVARVKVMDQRLSRTGKLQDAVDLELARSRVKPNGDGSRNR